jgi:hypothetical protein
MRAVSEVEAEVTAAGFVDIHHGETFAFHVVRGGRPRGRCQRGSVVVLVVV